MGLLGIGPLFSFLSISYAFATMFISYLFFPIFQIEFIPYSWQLILGSFLIIIGLISLFISVKAIVKAYNSNNLITSGIYSFCRHPLYASWVLFIVPGICFFVASWLVFTTPVFMYIIVRRLAKKEEEHLESIYGSKYLNYKRKTPSIIPYGIIKNFKSN